MVTGKPQLKQSVKASYTSGNCAFNNTKLFSSQQWGKDMIWINVVTLFRTTVKSQQLTQASAFHNGSMCWTHFLVNLSQRSHLPSERLNISQRSMMSLRSTWSTQIQIWTQLRTGGTAMWRFSWISFQACQIQVKNSYTFIRLVWKTNVAKKYVLSSVC